MTRLRYDGLTARTVAPLDPGDTLITFTTPLIHDGGTPVPDVTPGDVIAMSLLDTTRELVEIVHLTAYTSGAITGTISRGMEGTTARAHPTNTRVISAGNAMDFGDLAAAATAASTARLRETLKANQRDASIVIIGDSSTAIFGTPWTELLAGDRLGGEFPEWSVEFARWNDTNTNAPNPGAYGTPDVLQVGTGPNTLRVWNGGAGGTNLHYPLTNLGVMVVEPQPDLVIIDYGGNQGPITATNTQDAFRATYLCLTEAIRAAVPTASLLCISQHPPENPEPTLTDSYIAAEMIRQVCEARGYGYVNMTQVFADLGAAIGDYLQDGIHCNQLGQDLWVETIWTRAFATDAGYLGSQQPSSFIEGAGRNYFINGDFSSFDGTTLTGWVPAFVTLAKDAVNTDGSNGNGYSVETTSTGAGSGGFLSQSVSAAVLEFFKGKYATVTTCSRVETPAPDPSSARGVPFLYDGVTFAQGVPDIWSDGEFVYHAISMRVDEAANQLTGALVCDNDPGAVGTVNQWEWARLDVGELPHALGSLEGAFPRVNYKQTFGDANKQQLAINTGLIRAPESRLETGSFMILAGQGLTATSLLVASREYAVPFVITSEVTFDQLVVEVTAAGVGSVLRLGFRYLDPTTGEPLNGAPLLDAGTVLGTAIAVLPLGISDLTLKPGWYFYTITAQGGAPTVRASTPAAVLFPAPIKSTSNLLIAASVSGYYQDGVAGALPSTWASAGPINGISPPRMLGRGT